MAEALKLLDESDYGKLAAICRILESSKRRTTIVVLLEGNGEWIQFKTIVDSALEQPYYKEYSVASEIWPRVNQDLAAAIRLGLAEKKRKGKKEMWYRVKPDQIEKINNFINTYNQK